MSIATRIEFAFGADLTANSATWTWTDVSLYALGSVSVTFGRADEASTTQPATCRFRLRNTDARFSPRFPTSPYYPNVRRQTPVRVSLNPGTGYVQRFQGYVDQFEPVWPSGNSEYAEVSVLASGCLRRLGQGSSPVRSALYRAISQAGPVAYWPLEDGQNSTQGASGLLGGVPMLVTAGKVAFGGASGLPSSAPLVDFSTGGVGGSMQGVVPPGTSTTAWRFEFVTKFNALPAASFIAAVDWFTEGSVDLWEIVAAPVPGGGLYLQYITAAGVAGGPFLSNVRVDDGLWHHVRVDASQSGGNIALTVTLDGIVVITQALAALTMGRVARVLVNPTLDPSESVPTIGHLAVWAPFSSSVDTVTAWRGNAGETAGDRVVRLCAENNVPAAVSSTTGTTLMGPQAVATLLTLLRECEVADGGILYDGASAGISYLARQDRYNLPVALALDTQRQQVKLPFSPTEDDQRVRNDWTVSRPGGSSARYVDAAHVAANGRYDNSTTVNVQFDADLLNQASWRVHLGIVEEMRVPGLSLQLIDHSELWASWLATTLGGRLTAANLPTQYPPGILDMILEGYTEVWSAVSWQIAVNTGPFAPWLVFTVEGTANTGRLDTAGSTLTAAASAAATSFSAVSSTGPLWSTTSVPYDLEVGGEQVTATAVANAVTDAFGRTASSGWSTADSGQSWVVGAGTASLFSATGSVGQIAVSAINTEHHIAVNVAYAPYQRVRTYLTLGVTPTGAAINWGVMLRRADASNLYWIDVQVGTTGSLTLRVISKIAAVNTQLTTATSATVHSTSVARILLAEIDADNIIRAKVWADGATEPGWELVYDASAVVGLSTGPSVGCIARLATGNTNAAPVNFQFDNFAVLNPQTLTVTRAVNGVSKAQTASTAVRLWKPGVIAL